VDEMLARRYFGKRDPIGSRLVFPSDTVTVVGVAGYVTPIGVEPQDILPTLYVPWAQAKQNTSTFFVAIRTHGDPEHFAPVIKRTIFGLDQAVPVSDLKSMTTLLHEFVGTTRFSSFLASLFALIALVLGAVGIYSVLAYIVGQRRKEIGVRLALGASPGHVIGTVLRYALLLTGLGVALGSFAAWILTRVLAKLFQGVSPHDPKIFVGAIVGFGVIALIAATVPALRTTRVDPLVALTST
jgi:ABC-type antimicrobial peptide transport system permease subunit